MRPSGWGIAAVGGVVLLGALGLWWGRPAPVRRPLEVPPLSAEAESGWRGFERSCARCHGEHASGGASGPALVDPIYRPGHHSDMAFQLAVRRGVLAHHGRRGDMPGIPEVGPEELALIIRYVRELQRANGID